MIIIYIILSIYIYYSFYDVLHIVYDVFPILYLTNKKMSSRVSTDKKRTTKFYKLYSCTKKERRMYTLFIVIV